MEAKKYLRSYAPKNGFTKLVSIGDGDLKLTEFGILSLKAGQKHEFKAIACETALVVLGGKCSVEGDGFSFKGVGAREDVFSGKPHTVYIPFGRAFEVKAEGDVEIAWTASPSDLKAEPYLIAPEEVKEVHIGQDAFERDAYLMLTDKHVSATSTSARPSSPPASRPASPPQAREGRPALRDRHGGGLLLPLQARAGLWHPEHLHGRPLHRLFDARPAQRRHPDSARLPSGRQLPGYQMYYLWIMAGPNHRGFISVMDPNHKWIVGK
jgi:5-deoxy-glucuronate isomerase